MKLEQQVVSLTLAKRLKELGVKQESVFAWLQYPHTRAGEPNEWELTYTKKPEGNPLWVAAFTVAELGEMLPKNIEWHSTCGFTKDAWCCTATRPDGFHRTYGETEAEARGLMLAYLIENKLLSV